MASNTVPAAESALLYTLHYGINVPPSDLPGFAAREVRAVGGAITEEECPVGLAACLAKGWLQVVDEAVLAEIIHELRAQNFLGPIYHLPEVGTVDFTHQGADVWAELCMHNRSSRAHRAFAFVDVVHQKTSQYYRSESVAIEKIKELQTWDDGSVVSLVGPVSIGPWRVQWWRRYAEGYRIDIEEQCHWQGRCSSGNSWRLERPQTANNPERLQHILNCHNVSLGEWLLLSATDDNIGRYPRHFPHHAAGQAEKLFGIMRSEDECRHGLEACLDHGWLRVVDEEAALEIVKMLQTDSAIAPLYPQGEICLHQIDFTSDGAALYQVIAGEYFGRGWDSRINVLVEFYRKENRYCETEDGVRKALKKYQDCGETVQRSEVIPIGPWCVYWWERFPSGFMLEVEIGNVGR